MQNDPKFFEWVGDYGKKWFITNSLIYTYEYVSKRSQKQKCTHKHIRAYTHAYTFMQTYLHTYMHT